MSDQVLNFFGLVVIAVCLMMVAVKGSSDENNRNCTRQVHEKRRKLECKH